VTAADDQTARGEVRDELVRDPLWDAAGERIRA
jgi:hypothetical protein